MRLSLNDAEALARDALAACGASAEMAAATARTLVAAEAAGQAGHGLRRLQPGFEQAQAEWAGARVCGVYRLDGLPGLQAQAL